jgi:hypothetical protein
MNLHRLMYYGPPRVSQEDMPLAMAGAMASGRVRQPSPTTATRPKAGVSITRTSATRYATKKREREAPEGLAMMSSSRVELWRASHGGGVRNGALPRLSSLREEDKDVEGLKVEQGMQFGWW